MTIIVLWFAFMRSKDIFMLLNWATTNLSLVMRGKKQSLLA